MNTTARYDYIIAGAGCAGLSLVMHMIHSGKFTDKKILLVDKERKSANDRTWCFWETTHGLFESIVYKNWKQLWFHSDSFSSLLSIEPYCYKLIRGADFYRYCFSVIEKQPNVSFLPAAVEKIDVVGEKAMLTADGRQYEATYIFNSILFEKPQLSKKEYYLLQHFKGWVIETNEEVFDETAATLMDFRTGQDQGTTFVYVMPFSRTKALVEYTLFSNEMLETSKYVEGLENYIREKLGITSYKILEEEQGVIPMTNYAFPQGKGNIINIGTAGGQTKASSGYTFQFIQKQSAAIVEKLAANKKPVIKKSNRFGFYDSVLLTVLHHQTVAGDQIFTQLFKKNKPQQVLRFLDNESSFTDELKIISSLPTLPFLKAAAKQI